MARTGDCDDGQAHTRGVGRNDGHGTVAVSVHDCVKEVGDLARLFLLDFSDSSKPVEYVMRNFSTSSRCRRERDAEYSQVADNRVSYRIDSYTVGSPSVSFSFGGRPCSYSPRDGDACAAIPAVWNSTRLRDVDGAVPESPPSRAAPITSRPCTRPPHGCYVPVITTATIRRCCTL